MLIRTQDRNSLRTIEMAREIYIQTPPRFRHPCHKIMMTYPDSEFPDAELGRYSTPEKTYKALDKLYMAYHLGNRVFDMPQDEEV